MKFSSWMRGIIVSGLFLIPVIPFIVSSSMFFPFITGKNFVFRIIIDVIFFAWLILMMYEPHYRLKRSWIVIALSIFVGIMTVADIFGANFFRSFWSNFERMEGLVTLLHLLAYCVVLGSMFTKEKLWIAWFNTSVCVSVLMCLYGLGQISGRFAIHQGGVRVDGTLGNATYLAVYLLFHIFITLWLLYRARARKTLAAVYGVALILEIIILFYTATRGAILGVIGGFILTALIIALFNRTNRMIRYGALGSLGVLIIIIGVFMGVRHTPFIQHSPIFSRFADISVTDATIQSRFILWKNIAWSGFKEHPVLGWGQDNFIHVFGKYYQPEMYKQEPWFDRAHNVFFDWMIAGGLLGLVGYLSLFAAALIYLWKVSVWSLPEKALFTGMLAAYFFHNIFVFDNLISYIFFISVIAYIHSQAVSQDKQTNAKFENRNPKHEPKYWVLPQQYAIPLSGLTIVIACIVVYVVNIPGIATSQTLIHALGSAKNPEVSFKFYTEALSHHGVGREEVREQLALSAIRVAHGEAPQNIKQKFAQFADTESREQTEADPQNTRPLFFQGVFWEGIGHYEDALKAFNTALAINPNRHIILMEKGTVLSALNRPAEALELYKSIFELTPEYDEARVRYILTAYSLGDTQAVNEQIQVLETRVKEHADDAQAHYSLGTVYLNTGKREEAVIEFKKAMSLNSDFKQQGQAIIDAIEKGANVKINMESNG